MNLEEFCLEEDVDFRSLQKVILQNKKKLSLPQYQKYKKAIQFAKRLQKQLGP